MKSLRARLIAGSALVALVPLAVAMFFLSQRVETMVRTQAAERLSAALGGLQVELRADGGRIEGQLQILARDPTLKRLYLLQSAGSRDLSDYLTERRSLLGLDFLRLISHPRLFETLTSMGMRSKAWMSFLVQVMVNVAEPRGGGPGDRTFRAAVKLYEHRLEHLHDPVIAAPPVRRTRARATTAGTNGGPTPTTNGAAAKDGAAPADHEQKKVSA